MKGDLMKKTKLLAIGLVIVAIGLVAGVATAANQSGSGADAGVSPQVTTGNVELMLENTTVLVGTPAVTVLGAGWTPYTSALVKIKMGGGAPDMVLGGVTANKSGAFKLEISALPASLDVGIYTVVAKATTSGNNAAAPLVVVLSK